MDFIGTLAGQLGLEPDTAKALAGAVLGAAREQSPDDETAKLDEAVPELSEWQAMADAVMKSDDDDNDDAGGGLFGTLAKFAGSGVGNEMVGAVFGEDAQETAALVGLFEKLGLKTEHAAMAAPIVLDFLEERVGEEWAERIVKGAPMLWQLVKSQTQGGDAGGMSSLMGRLLGS